MALTRLVVGLSLALLAVTFVACGGADVSGGGQNPGAAQVAQTRSVTTCTADVLASAYEENEVAADRQFKNQAVEVTGTVAQVGKDVLGSPFVGLKRSGGSAPVVIQAVFQSDDERRLSAISKGDAVTIRGRCVGKTLGLVILRDCTVK